MHHDRFVGCDIRPDNADDCAEVHDAGYAYADGIHQALGGTDFVSGFAVNYPRVAQWRVVQKCQ
jgi:hypothetical protein